MRNGKNMFKAITKFLLVLLLVGASLGVLPNQKVQAATKYGVLFASFAGEYEVTGEGTVVMNPTVHETQYVWGGQYATRPVNPTRAEGYVFDNWYTDQNYTTLFNFNAPINAATTVWGRWLKSIEFKAHDESTGNTGGGKITVSGTFPGTSATQVGNSASFTQNMYESNTYTFIPTANNGYYFKGWSFNDPSNGPINYTDFTISPMWMSGQYGEIRTLYAVFGKMGTETQTWNAYEGNISEFRKEYSVSGAGISANGLYVLEDNNNITQTRWEGLTADGKLPASGNAKFIITLKGNPAVGSYPVVFYDNVSHRIINATIVVKHRVQKWLPLAATCSTIGYNTYWECQECGKCFSDEACTHETTKEAMQVPALGHSYGTWQYLNATQHRHYCSRNNGHYETRNHTWNDGVITTQPTTTAEGVKTYTCTGCGTTRTESVPRVVNTYIIKYHETDNATASNLVTNCTYGVSQQTATIQKLGFSTAGKSFKGWRAYREYDGTWWVMDASGKSSWKKQVPENGQYALWPEGKAVKTAAPNGVVHYYAQWEDNTYVIKYHESDTSMASNLVTNCTYGVSKQTATIQELDFSTTGRSFKGWRAYREYDSTWWVMDASGKSSWKKQVPENGQYALWPEGKAVKTAAPNGTVHYYAQWEDNTYVIKYHESDTSVASSLVTNCTYGVSKQTATIQELGFSTTGKSFKGWKAYREYDGTWWVMDASGKCSWMKQVPENGQYALWREGKAVKTAAPNGTVHYYAQWDK